MSSTSQRLVNLFTYALVFHLLVSPTSARQFGSNLFSDEPLGNVNRVSFEPSGGRFKRTPPPTAARGPVTSTTPAPSITQTTLRIALFGSSSGGVVGGDLEPTNGAKTTTSTTAPPPERTTTKKPAPGSSTYGPKTTTRLPTTALTSTKRLTSTSVWPTPTAKVVIPPLRTTTTTKPKFIYYQAKDVSLILESHWAISVHDPRSYMTNERFESMGGYLFEDIQRMPAKLRFAFIIRMFHELGRKLASKMNHFVSEVVPLLSRSPDEFGGKPGVEVYEGAFLRTINSKDDLDPSTETEATLEEYPISSRLAGDKQKAAAFNASITVISSKLGHAIIDAIRRAKQEKLIDISGRSSAVFGLICDAMENGARMFLDELATSDKFRVPDGVANYLESILRNVNVIIKRHERDNDWSTGPPEKGYIDFKATTGSTYTQMNPISDKQALVGPWNNYLFYNLGTSERVIKLFASLLSRVPVEAKSRWVNMYISQVKVEMEKTMATFVSMQSVSLNSDKSENYLLSKVANKQTNATGSFSVPANQSKGLLAKPRKDFDLNKNRLPARCYLAGRRWRLLLKRSMVGFEEQESVLRQIVEKVGEIKSKLMAELGNNLARVCLPRLEVGLKGWGINGDPHGDSGPNDFPLRNAIDNLVDNDDPFKSGVRLGYKIGFKVGYNEKRNATLEMENSNSGAIKDAKKKAEAEATYLARASYRRGATMGARKAFAIAVHEGYLTTLKVSLRAGMLIPTEAASRLAALKGGEFGGQAGQEAGRAMVNKFLVGKDLKDEARKSLRGLGESNGMLAGTQIGELIGSSVGKEAAEEAFRRSILRGGRLARAKWNLDQFEMGARDGFELGLKEGDKAASSSSLDPSAPRALHFAKPRLSSKDKQEQPVDHWDRDLMNPLTGKTLEELHSKRSHTIVRGTLKGVYKVSQEVKKSLRRVSYKNVTYNLDIHASGFIDDEVAYLRLDGKVNNFNVLHGSLVATDIFNEK